ncbi:DUF2960 domain-containing protein [Pseudoalteromonas tunicata]|uniref:DUF2960 domain-containing protein n=2 Tax=Pseudoalteromonas tunicata TaxID=314281 RepID=A4CDZ0_9GAMM|nr:DUF2960 domain-containing protein [Pseudoalteromonas tunicata]ATC96325.1 hypothetical protein PTUN_a4103 [Pseudoalteromonas tunicata]AXT31830.1 DUF2960 domain-containing protein [Pseudoalteromonas tunicata]EAR27182.1 hypothetical protein PTD2_05910 [Pseudoalteromonas tunicata D2]MDP5212238.1 DUF2960 domain-containing protein [Pseudoalteromonas tunicata]
MARRISYKFHGVAKEINFANDKYHDMFDAIAAAEGIDLTNYIAMEKQIAMTSKGSAAVKNFRDQQYIKFGFSDIQFIKDDPKTAK